MIELLRSRRSIRKYTNQPIEEEKVQLLKEALLRSPSSKNFNPWKFIFVDDQETLRKLKSCKPHGSGPLETAQLAVVICADASINDVWVEDCSIASILLQLTAHSIGLGSCWIQVRNRNHSETITSEEYIQEILGIPGNYKVLNIISAGYPLASRAGKAAEELQYEKIRKNRFQKS